MEKTKRAFLPRRAELVSRQRYVWCPSWARQAVGSEEDMVALDGSGSAGIDGKAERWASRQTRTIDEGRTCQGEVSALGVSAKACPERIAGMGGKSLAMTRPVDSEFSLR